MTSESETDHLREQTDHLREQLDRRGTEAAMAMFRAGEPHAETYKENTELRRALSELIDLTAPLLLGDREDGAAPGVAEVYRRARAALAGPDSEATP